jgi:hypothetical protein
MLSMLISDTYKEWELHTAHQDIRLTTEVIRFLETRCKAMELLQNAQVPKTILLPFHDPHNQLEWRSVNLHILNIATQVQCHLCKVSQ